MAYLENLIARRDQIAADLAALDATKAGGKPNGPSGIDHQGYVAQLMMQLDKLDILIKEAQTGSDGPIEIISQGIT